MGTLIDHTRLHRTAKYFMDTGRASTHGEAMRLLHGYGLTVHVGSEVNYSVQHQIALLTLVNLARRTFLNGVEVIGVSDAPQLTSLARTPDLGSAVELLGGKLAEQANGKWPVASIGSCATDMGTSASWQLTWTGWRGGVVLAQGGCRLNEHTAIPLAPAVAAAACAAEVFAWYAGDHPMAGKRISGISLWRPGKPWIEDDASEPELSFLPSRLWLIGLGNLGQAFAWLLACLPYADQRNVELVLQDFDRITESNDSTSVLSSRALIGQKKSLAIGAWLEAIGFSTTIEERRFGAWTLRGPHEPGVALCGVDNAQARSDLGKAGFDLVVEAGLGAGPDGFRNFSMHSFPSSRSPEQMWSRHIQDTSIDVSVMPAYVSLRKAGLDICGLAQLASRTVGVPYVGLIAGALAISELLRRLHGGTGLELVSGSAASLEDVEALAITCAPYAWGHLPALHSGHR